MITTGQTGAELWRRMDLEGRRRILLEAGAMITVSPSKGGRVTTLDTTRLTFALGETDPERDALRAVELDEAA